MQRQRKLIILLIILITCNIANMLISKAVVILNDAARVKELVKNQTRKGFEVEGKEGEIVEWVAEGPRDRETWPESARRRSDVIWRGKQMERIDSEIMARKDTVAVAVNPMHEGKSSCYGVMRYYTNDGLRIEVSIEPARTITGEPYVCTNCLIYRGGKDEETDSDSGNVSDAE